MLEELWFNRYSISPALAPGKIRIVLDWASRPADLDAHLVKKGQYHISYRDKRKFEDQAALDRDDRDGYGPETVTIERLDPKADYAYFVHDYTNRKRADSSDLSASKAHVLIYADGQLKEQMWLSGGAPGRIWHVLDIRQGGLQPTNRLQDRVP